MEKYEKGEVIGFEVNTVCSKMKVTQKMAIKHTKYGFWTIYLAFLYSTHQKDLLGILI